MAQWCCTATVLVVLLVTSTCSADWTLVVAHSNDLLFQLDEIKADNTPCYVDLPPVPTTTTTVPTTTEKIPTTTETPTTTQPSTTTSVTSPTPETSPTTQPTTASESTTTSIPTTPATDSSTVPSEASSETEPSSSPAANTKMSKSTTASSPSQLSTLHSRRRRRQAALTSQVDASTVYSTPPANATSSHSVLRNRTTVSPLNTAISFSNETQFNNDDTTAPSFNNTTTTSTTAEPTQGETADCYGGVPRHLTMARQLKTESESKNKVFLHLNAGGMLGGNIWFPILGSGPAAESVAKLSYDAIALGYRDFDEGVPTAVEYLKQLKSSGVTVLCANIDTSKEPEMAGLIKKSTTIVKGDHKIGIIGYIGADADYLADTGKLTFEDEAMAISKEVTILFGQGVNFIIALGNAGYDRGKTLLNTSLNVDLIINGGGASVFQYTGSKGPLNETVKDPYPFVWEAPGYGNRLLVTTSRYGKYMGKLEMTIADDGKIKGHSSDSNPILLDPKVQQDPEMQLQVDEWERTVLIESNETIGYTKLPIVSDRSVCWYRECTGASMMADAARWYLEHNVTVNNGWYDSVAAVVWHGGALSNTDLGLTAGPIKFGDILYMFPYANVLAMARMTGAQIKMLFENSVQNYNDTSAPKMGEFLHASGMRIEFDLSKEKGSRVASITIRDTSNPDGEHAPLKLESVYRIGMPSFIARGGSNYAFMDTIPHVDTGIRDEIALRAFISWTTPLAYGNDGRIQFVQPDVDPGTNCPNVNVTGTVFLTIFLTLLFAGLTFAAFKYLYPKLRDRRGSMMSLVR